MSPDGEELPSDPSARSGRRRRRRLLGAGTLLVTFAVVAVLVATRGDDADDGSSTSEAGSASTGEVSRRTLTQTDEIAGTLDFGDPHSLTAGRESTLTSAAAAGSTVDRGEDLFSIDRQPTVLLFGDLPLYRDLEAGIDDGPDVAQLEENLSALGFTDDGQLVVDEHFDAATTDAVEAWQDARGAEVTGTVTRGDAVFLPGAVRIAEPRLDVGATVQSGSAVVDYTSSTQVVRVQLEIGQADLAQVGDEVTVGLPDGSEIAGTVSTIANSTSSSDQSTDESGGVGAVGAGGGSTDETDAAGATVELTVSLADPAAVVSFTTASVDVLFTSGQREDVLTVPVTALLALLGGGYAVEVPDGDDPSQLVPVEPGMFADGYVEITGDGIEEGTQVVVPE